VGTTHEDADMSDEALVAAIRPHARKEASDVVDELRKLKPAGGGP